MGKLATELIDAREILEIIIEKFDIEDQYPTLHEKELQALRTLLKAENEPQEKPKRVHVVTADGWKNGDGSEIYLIGVFYDKDTAERAAKKNKGIVTEIIADKAHPLKKSGNDKANDYYLGGYIE